MNSVSLQGEIRTPQTVSVVDVVQKRREPLLPFSLSCLTYSLERALRVGPAPSLHPLRGRFLGSVRRLPQDVGTPEYPLWRGMYFAARSPACTFPCQRFTSTVTRARA